MVVIYRLVVLGCLNSGRSTFIQQILNQSADFKVTKQTDHFVQYVCHLQIHNILFKVIIDQP